MITNLQKLKIGLLGAFALALSTNSSAQGSDVFRCANPERLEALYKTNPEFQRDHEAFLQNIFNNRAIYDDSTVYEIPIVFHIIHQFNGNSTFLPSGLAEAENIADANIYSQMNTLNKDYRKLNADVGAVDAAFVPIVADVKIHFKLPTLDPNGQCTNGIEHIYSHETTQGDDNSKLSLWPRDRYINVWITDFIGTPGAAGYAYYPSAMSGFLAFADGIILECGYIGSLSPSSAFTSRALTHEIGHYLNLAHTWGSTNSPEVACGNDGIGDTPETKGHLSCPSRSEEHTSELQSQR